MPFRPPLAFLAALLVAAGCTASPPVREAPPGAAPRPPELARRLDAALAARGRGYRPNTRHLRDDGSPRWCNRLILESSPYLLQHAHNPVDWYPWGDEAFARASAENKPVLLSIGYATCHWCHVMEEESFEDEEVATYLNEHYVAIKVDREERPDLDDAYMIAVQLVSGSGGWPMTVWLTPTREPFYGGTYFPPHDGERGVKVGFLTLLGRLRDAFDESPLRVADQASALSARLREVATPPAGDAIPDAGLVRTAVASFTSRFDEEHGGFGRAPKFPLPAGLDLLLRYQRRSGDRHALDMVTRTLDAMAAGGIHDQVGGGFHRYATDVAWRVPHFEKMLYDNAQLAVVYLDAGRAAGRDDLTAVARDILDYVAREMTAPGGAFWAATDADSDGEEGRFFTWTPAEIAAALPPDQAALATAVYGVTPEGDLHGQSILYRARTLEEVADGLGLAPADATALFARARAGLYAARARRTAPRTDTQVVTAWNGLMIGAFARAGAALAEPAYLDAARRAAGFILEQMRPTGRLQRTFADGVARQDAFLEDYAFLASGLLDLYQATFEVRWLRAALALHETLANQFWDDDADGFFATASDQPVPFARTKPADDGVLPSGNAVAADTLLRLAELTGDDAYRTRADAILHALAPAAHVAPTTTTRLLAALDFATDKPKEIVVVGRAGDEQGIARLLATVRAAYLPNHVLVAATEGPALAAQAELVPLAADKRALGGRPTAYVCQARACDLPTSDPEVLRTQLATTTPLPGADAIR